MGYDVAGRFAFFMGFYLGVRGGGNAARRIYSGTSLEGTRHQGKSQSKGQWCSVPTFSL